MSPPRRGGGFGRREAAIVSRILDRVAGRRVLIYGDLVCDAYLHTVIERVSREAPVLIVRHREREVRAGGAANAARNVASLGGRAVPVGIVGTDGAGDDLKRLLRKDRAGLGGLISMARHRTPVKTRVLASSPHGVQQQVLRVDETERLHWSRRVEEDLRAALGRGLRRADSVLVSDYGLGSVHPRLARWLFDEAARRGVPRLVDSRHRLEEFPGATLAAPNEPELEEIAGRSLAGDPEGLAGAGASFLKRQGLEALVVTQGGDGMTVIRRDAKPVRVPIFGTDEVADVTGAGDTVAAALSLALAAGAEAAEAALLATVAAGLVVMKKGTSTVTAEEVRAALAG